MTTVKTRDELSAVSAYPLGPPPEELQKEMGFPRVLRMSDNENPYGMSPLALEAAKKELVNISKYPDGTYSGLVKALSRHHGMDEEFFIAGNGSDEVIRLLTRAYISKGDEAVMANCTFPRYKTNVLIEGGISVEVPLKDGVHDLDAMLSAITEKTKIVFVCNPNNPTGTISDKRALLGFLGRVPEDVLVAMDEAYVEYVSPGAMNDAKTVLAQFKNVAILRTFSKIHGLAGLRVGYGMMDPEIAGELKKVKDVFNVNRAAAAAAAASLDDAGFLASSAAKNRGEREYMAQNLREFGFSPLPSETNFIFVPVNSSAREIEAALAAKGIFVKGMSSPAYPNGLRVSFGTREENDLFLEAICSFAKEGVV